MSEWMLNLVEDPSRTWDVLIKEIVSETFRHSVESHRFFCALPFISASTWRDLLSTLRLISLPKKSAYVLMNNWRGLFLGTDEDNHPSCDPREQRETDARSRSIRSVRLWFLVGRELSHLAAGNQRQSRRWVSSSRCDASRVPFFAPAGATLGWTPRRSHSSKKPWTSSSNVWINITLGVLSCRSSAWRTITWSTTKTMTWQHFFAMTIKWSRNVWPFATLWENLPRAPRCNACYRVWARHERSSLLLIIAILIFFFHWSTSPGRVSRVRAHLWVLTRCFPHQSLLRLIQRLTSPSNRWNTRMTWN